MDRIPVMLVDDNPVFLKAATQFLEAHEDVVVLGATDKGAEALGKAQTLHPRVILIDLAMPDVPGLKAIPGLRAALPEVGIVALTVMDNASFRQAALAAGADVFLPKASMRKDLLPAIRHLAQNGRNGKQELDVQLTEPAPRQDVRRILIIEDDADLRRLFCKALSAAGYEVDTAGTIQKAHDLLAQSRYDLLLCDIHMGGERGTDLLEQYADTLATSGAQIVMVSGQAHYREACADIGADFFLEKPISIETLVTLVNRLLAR